MTIHQNTRIFARNINWTILYYIIALLILLTINILFIILSNKRIKHSQEIIHAVQLVETNLDGIESGVLRGIDIGLRGYAITQNEELLEPYHFAFDFFEENIIPALHQNITSLNYDLNSVDSIQYIVDDYLRYSQKMQILILTEGLAAYRLELTKDYGKDIWNRYDHFRKLLKERMNNDVQLINVRLNSLQRKLILTQVLSVLISILLFVLIYRTISLFSHEKERYINQIDEANSLLKVHQENLENEVKLKTLELSNSNEELKTTIEKMKQIQSHLVQSEKMASVGILAAGVAHEINNPLNFIMGVYESLRKHFSEGNISQPENMDELLRILKTGVDRTAGIVQELNNFTNTNAHQNDRCDINHIIDNSLRILQTKINSNIKIIKDYEEEKAMVSGNSGELHQVFLNVVSNAVQAIEDEGVIQVSTTNSENYIEARIRDTGIGIPQENLKNIFDPFFTTKDPDKGIGMGLATAYNILKEHNGSIEFESEPGVGTTVCVKLPKV